MPADSPLGVTTSYESATRLFDVAISLFAEHGYDNVTTTQIAEAAGVTQRTFFRHYPTKADVLEAEVYRMTKIFVDLLHSQPPHMPLLDALVAAIETHTQDETLRRHSEMIGQITRGSASLQGLTSRYHHHIEHIFSEWVAARTGRESTEIAVAAAGAMLVAARRVVMDRWMKHEKLPEDYLNMVHESLEAVQLLQS